MEDVQQPPETILPAVLRKGRGAAENPAGRFETLTRVREDDGWGSPEPDGSDERGTLETSPATRLEVDTARTVISRNDSPDLPFDRSLNPYRGCEHGCIYCYARSSHAFLGLSPGLDFETRIFHKPEAALLLRRELGRPAYAGTGVSPLALGTNTDPYQPAERKLGLTRAVLEVLAETGHPLSIVTKSALVTRDLELLAAMARNGLAQVTLSVTTLDPALARTLEPRATAPARRLETIAELAAAGIPTALFFAPVIPGLNDHEMERVLAAGREAGALDAHYTALRLPREVAPLFEGWLARHASDKAARIMSILYDLRGGRADDPRFGSRMTGLGHFARLIEQRFALAHRRLGFPGLPALDCTRFKPPRPDKAEPDSAATGSPKKKRAPRPSPPAQSDLFSG